MLPFVKFVRPHYRANWHHEVVCRKLDAFAKGLIKRLMVFMPPRAGKSELASRALPAYMLGHNPDLNLIATSYSADLARMMNRDVQRIIDSRNYQLAFPETRLGSSNIRTVCGRALRNSDLFEVVDHRGVYRCAGVGGGITGMGGDVIILDDVIKNQEEAQSVVYREKLWEWYTTTLYTRLQGEPGGILLIVTRWHEDDLAGRLLAKAKEDPEADQWEVISCEAIREIAKNEDDEKRSYDQRTEGEALWPARFPVSRLTQIRSSVGEATWSALYQQRPSPPGGGILKRANWQYYKPPCDLETATAAEVRTQLGLIAIVQSWDTAHTEKKQNDFNSCHTWGVTKNRYLSLDVFTQRMEYPELKRAVMQKAEHWNPDVVLVEDKAAGLPLVQELRRETRIPLLLWTPVGDKVARANAIAAPHEAGLFALPEGAQWVDAFVESCASFPNAPHDDDVDAFTQGAAYMRSTSAYRLGDIQIDVESGLQVPFYANIGGAAGAAPHLSPTNYE